MSNQFNAVEANGKFAMFRFVPGWGEPGEWMVQLGNHTLSVMNDVAGMGNQLEYLQQLVSDEYILKTADENWARVGIRDDAIRYCLNYTGYNGESRAHDMKIVDSLNRMAERNSESIADFYTEIPDDAKGSFDYLGPHSESFRKRILGDASSREAIVNAYDRMVKGEHIGIGWSNESLLTNFPDSREAKLVAEHLWKKTTGIG